MSQAVELAAALSPAVVALTVMGLHPRPAPPSAYLAALGRAVRRAKERP